MYLHRVPASDVFMHVTWLRSYRSLSDRPRNRTVRGVSSRRVCIFYGFRSCPFGEIDFCHIAQTVSVDYGKICNRFESM